MEGASQSARELEIDIGGLSIGSTRTILARDRYPSLPEGDKVRIGPNHACSVANFHRHYFGLRDGHIDEILQIDAAGAIH